MTNVGLAGVAFGEQATILPKIKTMVNTNLCDNILDIFSMIKPKYDLDKFYFGNLVLNSIIPQSHYL